MDSLKRSPIAQTLFLAGAIAASIVFLLILPHLEPDHSALTIHGLFDWIGHLLTALVLVIGIRAMGVPVPAWSILLGGIIIDLGHVPQMFGMVGSLEGSSRNGSHSLTVVAAIALVGYLDRRRAHIWLGLAIGAVSHLWRDMGTGTVALLWPLTDTVYGTTFHRYLAVLAGIAIAMVGSAGLLDTHARATTREGKTRASSRMPRVSLGQSPTLPAAERSTRRNRRRQ